jgi:hypothetical protein
VRDVRKAIIPTLLVCAGCWGSSGNNENTASLLAANPCAGATSGRVAVPSDVKSVAVIFDGWKDGGCRNDVVCTGAPNVYLGTIDREKSSQCPSQEFAAFAPRRTAAGDTWPPEATLFGQPPATIDVAFWLVAAEGRMALVESTAVANAVDAAQLFKDFGTGVALRFQAPGSTGEQGSFRHILEGSDEAQLIGPWCYQSDVIAASADGRRPVYVPNALNVYYVTMYGSGHAGRDCWDYGHGEILFISYDLGGSAAKLAHEIGHGLGLVRPVGTWGHTNDMVGFPGGAANLMYSAVADVTTITLGQVYRLNFDSVAWFHRQGPAKDRLFRACQDSDKLEAPCPPLALSTEGRWPP